MSVWVSSSASSGDEERPRDGWGEQAGLGVWRRSEFRRLAESRRLAPEQIPQKLRFQLGVLCLQRERFIGRLLERGVPLRIRSRRALALDHEECRP